MDVTTYWNFSDPAETERTFVALKEASDSPVERAIFDTQIARTFSLRREFDQARETLGIVDTALDPEVLVRYELEIGRTENSSGNKAAALHHFQQASRVAQEHGLEYLYVDALHMEAIASPDVKRAIERNEKALAVSESATDETAKNWQGSLLNNLAWAHHDEGNLERALELFESTVHYWTERGKLDRLRIAKWSVARCLRSLERYEEALGMQRILLDEEGDPSGYTSQEIAWNLVALERASDAKPFFQKAIAVLSADDWYVAEKSDELEKMKQFV